jgi:hypothetical protein
MNFTEQNNPIHTILADNEFESIRESMEALGVVVNVTAKEEHVPEIERQHRVIKEHARAVIQTLPFKNMPKKMRIALIHNVVFWLNNIPKVGQEHSPKDLVFGDQLLHYKVVCRIPFGAYAQVHDDQSITNTMESRTTGAIILGTTGNIQGTHRFLSLRTGEIIVRRTWNELPVPRDVIDRLDELTANEPDYENDINIEDEEEDNNDQDQEANEEEIDVNPPNVNIEDEPQPTIETEENNNNDLSNEENDEFEQEEKEVKVENEEMQENAQGYNLCTNRIRDYSHCFTFLSVQARLKQFGQKGKEVILEELKMFLAKKVFAYIKNPTPEQIRQALQIHCFLTEKQNGRVKARAVADGDLK